MNLFCLEGFIIRMLERSRKSKMLCLILCFALCHGIHVERIRKLVEIQQQKLCPIKEAPKTTSWYAQAHQLNLFDRIVMS